MEPENNPYSAPSVTTAPPVFPTSPQNFIPASRGQRFLNYLIDTTVLVVGVGVLAFIYGVVAGGTLDDENAGEGVAFNLMIYGLFAIYYAIFESTTGVTLGKLVTGTKVVDANGNKPSFGKALGRSLCRFIPFEPFSLFNSESRGWHDSIPKTWVVRSR
ncbi:RDD family protein [Luteolibacter sp. GHJ8]|uniref:RDD family protein n=1 Tax=Luteolibacter rhizosphaerae TaxID=2989719 RepID=A0ABT3G2Y1_9BACT|nr:RDD family protein [Luteolibacter rhizosphaerae]MCW1913899.1 RDD family protein [Luteolibacter rhizosphaerae]